MQSLKSAISAGPFSGGVKFPITAPGVPEKAPLVGQNLLEGIFTPPDPCESFPQFLLFFFREGVKLPARVKAQAIRVERAVLHGAGFNVRVGIFRSALEAVSAYHSQGADGFHPLRPAALSVRMQQAMPSRPAEVNFHAGIQAARKALEADAAKG
jgi:hypothetical protein